MATVTASTDTASTIHSEIIYTEKELKKASFGSEKYLWAKTRIETLKRELNKINYEASLQTPD